MTQKFSHKKPTKLKEDNQSAIKLFHDATFHHMTKHIDIQYHMVKDFQIQSNFISMN
jgi:hypothetical protein